MGSEMATIQDAIKRVEPKFLEIAPDYLSFDEEAGYAGQLLRNNGYLASVASSNPRSLYDAVFNVAAIGLSLNPAEKLAYLIPRNIKVGQNQYEQRIFLEPSYIGLIRLATDSGSVAWMHANVVYANDDFIDNGPGEKPAHKYQAFSKDRGEFIGTFATAKLADGDYLTVVIPADEVYGIRDRSEAWKRSQSGPWKTDFAEMAKKTALRRLFKTLPRTDERRMSRLAAAIHLSNENEGFEPILTTPNAGQYTVDQKQYFDALIEQSNAIGMFALRKTLDELIFNNLYHSFEKPKGKWQKIVDELLANGREKFVNMAADIEGALTANDDLVVKEIAAEMSSDESEVLLSMLSNEAARFYREASK